MDNYLNSLGEYSPISYGTGIATDDQKIIEMKGVPQITVMIEEGIPEDFPKYMAPKSIEVRRYRLKK